MDNELQNMTSYEVLVLYYNDIVPEDSKKRKKFLTQLFIMFSIIFVPLILFDCFLIRGLIDGKQMIHDIAPHSLAYECNVFIFLRWSNNR